jgi:hypothetical protein
MHRHMVWSLTASLSSVLLFFVTGPPMSRQVKQAQTFL